MIPLELKDERPYQARPSLGFWVTLFYPERWRVTSPDWP
jgi:hypothetical protein